MYDNPLSAAYNYPEMDFGATSGVTTHRIAGPAGMQGQIRGIGVATTEAFATSTALANVMIGIIGDTDKYAKLQIANTTAVNTNFTDANDTDAVIIRTIPKDTHLLVTLTEGTDGSSVTGKGYPTIYIDWFK